MAYFVRSCHIRFLFTKDQERDRDHTVCKAASEVTCITDPDHHCSSCKRSQHSQGTDQIQRINRSFVLRMKLCKKRRNHVGFCHRVHGTGTTKEEGVPGCNNTTHSAYNDNLGHNLCPESLGHGICCYKSCSLLRLNDLCRIQDITYCKNNQ